MRSGDLGVSSKCSTCMEHVNEIARQSLGCAYAAPAPPSIAIVMWQPSEGYNGPEPTICAGYSTRLPEVVEAVRAWQYWTKGELSHITAGDPATEQLQTRLEQVEVAVNEFLNAKKSE